MNYTFDRNLFTTTGSGTPPALNVSLSASTGSVAINALSGAYVGLAYNIDARAITPTLSARQAVTVSGNTMVIASGHNGQAFALLKSDRTATIFTFLSAGGTIVPTETTTDLSYPALRRLSVLGYV
jgi:hypothetical protein